MIDDVVAGLGEGAGLAQDARVGAAVVIDEHRRRGSCEPLARPTRTQRRRGPSRCAPTHRPARPPPGRPARAHRPGPAPGARARPTPSPRRVRPPGRPRRPKPATVSTHSVVSRSTRHGTPSHAASRWTPPESVSTAAACSCAAIEERYPSGSTTCTFGRHAQAERHRARPASPGAGQGRPAARAWRRRPAAPAHWRTASGSRFSARWIVANR